VILQNLEIENFRNIIKSKINFNEKKNYIVGKNGQGKTNLIEIIYYLAFLKSFRTNKTENIIKNTETFTRITANVLENKVINNLKTEINTKNRQILLNDKKTDLKEYCKKINVILYYPEEVVYVSNFPSKRRNLLDKSIFTLNKDYAIYYNKYLRCLKQRNICLKKNIDSEDWLIKLIEYGFYIVKERHEYIKRLNKLLEKLSKEIINNEFYSIDYQQYDSENYKSEIYHKHKDNIIKEKRLGYTLFGPHTDTLNFLLNSKPLSTHASEGQKRTFAFLYKSAQLIDYKNFYNDFPILILDDVASELDKEREKILLDKIIESCSQVFITTTNTVTAADSHTSIFEVNNGNISKLTNHEVL
jgi:DNA replication and repair protein RecF